MSAISSVLLLCRSLAPALVFYDSYFSYFCLLDFYFFAGLACPFWVRYLRGYRADSASFSAGGSEVPRAGRRRRGRGRRSLADALLGAQSRPSARSNWRSTLRSSSTTEPGCASRESESSSTARPVLGRRSMSARAMIRRARASSCALAPHLASPQGERGLDLAFIQNTLTTTRRCPREPLFWRQALQLIFRQRLRIGVPSMRMRSARDADVFEPLPHGDRARARELPFRAAGRQLGVESCAPRPRTRTSTSTAPAPAASTSPSARARGE